MKIPKCPVCDRKMGLLECARTEATFDLTEKKGRIIAEFTGNRYEGQYEYIWICHHANGKEHRKDVTKKELELVEIYY